MKGGLLLMSMRNFTLIHLLLFATVAIFSTDPWPSLLLTIAQLVYVPIALRIVINKGDWFSKTYMYFAVPAYLAVALLQMTSSKWDSALAGVYLIFTIFIAVYGLSRFIKRGFTHLEEFAIDLGLMYLAIGGGWFFAAAAQINTGFSPLLTWLTGIHFHYSAFLLPIFIGLLGRLSKSIMFNIIASILLVSPIIVAIGITYSTWIEVGSVILYIIGLSGLIYIAWKTAFTTQLQKWLLRISFSSLGVTILFSLLYALGNRFGDIIVTIDFMLLFHGVLNCLGFGLFGIIGWSLFIPSTNFFKPTFPVSQIRGKWVIGEQILDNKCCGNHQGLVEDMHNFEPQINCKTLSPLIISFYENTGDFRLFASTNWHLWFKPFALFYQLLSRNVKQINLPFLRCTVEMTGELFTIKEGVDGREQVRAWVRKIQDKPVFIALYSKHVSHGRTYMNIALPLPFSTMIGILELNQIGEDLQLTSKKVSSPNSDAGIYLSYWKNELFKLPIQETFIIGEGMPGKGFAQHKMTIFGIPFLTIEYKIYAKAR